MAAAASPPTTRRPGPDREPSTRRRGRDGPPCRSAPKRQEGRRAGRGASTLAPRTLTGSASSAASIGVVRDVGAVSWGSSSMTPSTTSGAATRTCAAAARRRASSSSTRCSPAAAMALEDPRRSASMAAVAFGCTARARPTRSRASSPSCCACRTLRSRCASSRHAPTRLSRHSTAGGPPECRSGAAGDLSKRRRGGAAPRTRRRIRDARRGAMRRSAPLRGVRAPTVGEADPASSPPGLDGSRPPSVDTSTVLWSSERRRRRGGAPAALRGRARRLRSASRWRSGCSCPCDRFAVEVPLRGDIRGSRTRALDLGLVLARLLEEPRPRRRLGHGALLDLLRGVRVAYNAALHCHLRCVVGLPVAAALRRLALLRLLDRAAEEMRGSPCAPPRASRRPDGLLLQGARHAPRASRTAASSSRQRQGRRRAPAAAARTRTAERRDLRAGGRAARGDGPSRRCSPRRDLGGGPPRRPASPADRRPWRRRRGAAAALHSVIVARAASPSTRSSTPRAQTASARTSPPAGRVRRPPRRLRGPRPRRAVARAAALRSRRTGGASAARALRVRRGARARAGASTPMREMAGDRRGARSSVKPPVHRSRSARKRA